MELFHKNSKKERLLQKEFLAKFPELSSTRMFRISFSKKQGT